MAFKLVADERDRAKKFSRLWKQILKVPIFFDVATVILARREREGLTPWWSFQS